MPVQSAFTLLIIGGAFAAAAGLIGAANYVYEGKRRRSIGDDHFTHYLQQRDYALQEAFRAKKK